MKLRKMICLLLALCLAVACAPALAAPTRDTQAVEVTLDEKLLSLTELMVNAVILQGFPVAPGNHGPIFEGLEQDAVPSEALAKCVLAWGIQNGILPYGGEIGETITLKSTDAKDLLNRVFTQDGYALPAELELWNQRFAAYCAYGVHIYSAEFDGTDVNVKCDVYSVKNADFRDSAENVPEDALVWEYNAQLSLRFAPDTPFGYTVNSVAFSPAYRNGDLSGWAAVENTEYEYSFNLPASLGAADETPAHRVWQSADGSVTLTLDAQEKAMPFDQAVAQYMGAHPGAKLIQERDFCRFCVFGEGSFTMVCASENLSWTYTLTLTFPAERQAEYALYAEILRNSLSVWGVSNG